MEIRHDVCLDVFLLVCLLLLVHMCSSVCTDEISVSSKLILFIASVCVLFCEKGKTSIRSVCLLHQPLMEYCCPYMVGHGRKWYERMEIGTKQRGMRMTKTSKMRSKLYMMQPAVMIMQWFSLLNLY